MRLISVSVVSLLVLALGCGTSVRNPGDEVSTGLVVPGVEVKFSSFGGTAFNILPEFFIPSASAAVTQLQFCIREIEFDHNQSELGLEEFEIPGGLIDVSGNGTLISSLDVPGGVYGRVEIELEDICGTGFSTRLTNDNGTFEDDDDSEIKFAGVFDLSANAEAIELQIAALITQLDSVTNGNQIEDILEDFEGGIELEDDDD